MNRPIRCHSSSTRRRSSSPRRRTTNRNDLHDADTFQPQHSQDEEGPSRRNHSHSRASRSSQYCSRGRQYTQRLSSESRCAHQRDERHSRGRRAYFGSRNFNSLSVVRPFYHHFCLRGTPSNQYNNNRQQREAPENSLRSQRPFQRAQPSRFNTRIFHRGQYPAYGNAHIGRPLSRHERTAFDHDCDFSERDFTQNNQHYTGANICTSQSSYLRAIPFARNRSRTRHPCRQPRLNFDYRFPPRRNGNHTENSTSHNYLSSNARTDSVLQVCYNANPNSHQNPNNQRYGGIHGQMSHGRCISAGNHENSSTDILFQLTCGVDERHLMSASYQRNPLTYEVRTADDLISYQSSLDLLDNITISIGSLRMRVILWSPDRTFFIIT
ncbi:hypothetical protein PoB_006593200 [Plakobranchus ocellatus]|uniref:Uncharacterized protein n=1 Tax=Plakobranchus ocellatus TaxID=259542 RepID=A0AAV4D5K8_9GAST|nr:hypothetical protein PoB_006593200 [Plakobranchus ocellatus]